MNQYLSDVENDTKEDPHCYIQRITFMTIWKN
jgi:hypothetical protein